MGQSDTKINTASATVALNLSEKLRLFVICVSCIQGWIHLSTLSSFARPLQYAQLVNVAVYLARVASYK